MVDQAYLIFIDFIVHCTIVGSRNRVYLHVDFCYVLHGQNSISFNFL